MLGENAYWQYFCGYAWGAPRMGVSENCFRRFRQSLGEAGLGVMMKELCRLGLRVGAYKKKTCARRLWIRRFKLKISNTHMMPIY